MDAYKILIVDDMFDNLGLMVSIFETYRPEYVLYQTNSAVKALEILPRVMPDIIITDWDMPTMNGIDFIKAVRKTPEQKLLPIIMATGVNLTSADLETALNAGATDYVRKPIDPVELVARTHSALVVNTYNKQMLAIKDEQLTENSLYLIKNNQFYLSLSKKIANLSQLITASGGGAINLLTEIHNEIENRMSTDSWYRFNLSFDKVHQNFNKNLVATFPDLTATELKLCAFIRLGLKNKDIADLLNQSPDSIKVTRSRLRKKLNIEPGANLETFIAGF